MDYRMYELEDVEVLVCAPTGGHVLTRHEFDVNRNRMVGVWSLDGSSVSMIELTFLDHLLWRADGEGK
jgi:hypothetical protein